MSQFKAQKNQNSVFEFLKTVCFFQFGFGSILVFPVYNFQPFGLEIFGVTTEKNLTQNN